MKKSAAYTRDQVDSLKVSLNAELKKQNQLLSLKSAPQDIKPLLDDLSKTKCYKELCEILNRGGIDISVSSLRRHYKRSRNSSASSTAPARAVSTEKKGISGGFAALARQNG